MKTTFYWYVAQNTYLNAVGQMPAGITKNYDGFGYVPYDLLYFSDDANKLSYQLVINYFTQLSRLKSRL